jgi:hypothetical protein
MTKISIVIIPILLLTQIVFAQNHLSKIISVNVKSLPLQDALMVISNEGDFAFSYNSKVVKKDSIVSITAKSKSVQDILRTLFKSGYDFKESGNYIIIRRKVITTSSVISNSPVTSDHFYITGVIIDEETGDKIPDATIYEQQNLISSMTDEKGNLKNKFKTASVSISKQDYKDTTVEIKTNFNQKLTIALAKKEPEFVAMEEAQTKNEEAETGTIRKEDYVLVLEKKWFTNLFLTSKQKIQSLNLKKFYTTRGYQFSIIPGIGTHGKMNPQVVNGISINLIGGYSGGTSIVEVGGIFNIDKRDVKSCQIAGAVNLVGGKMDGVQISSLYNEVNDTVRGTQIAGLANVAKKEVKGIQIASLYNKAKNIKGLQIGFVNVTDGTDGTSVGLINISKGKRAKHRVGFILRVPRKSNS